MYFKEKKNGRAPAYFEKIDVSYLNDAEISEYYFKSGYSYFMKGDNLKAIAAFRQITNVENKYRTAANYYFSIFVYSTKTTKLPEYFSKFKRCRNFWCISAAVNSYILFCTGKIR